MQTKNINHDHRQHNRLQANQHHASCASFRLRAQPQVTSGRTTSALNSSTATCHNRAKTPVPPGSSAIASITSDDSCRLEAEQVPTSEANLQQQCLASTEGITQTRPLTSQAALISSGSKQSGGQHEQVPQSRTFSRDEHLYLIEDDYVVDLEQNDHCLPQTTQQVQKNQHLHHCPNEPMQSRRVSVFSGSQPSLTTLSAFVTGANHHQPSGHQHPHRSCHSPSQQMLLCAANRKTPPHQVAYTQQRCFANEPSEAPLSAVSALASHKPHSNFGHSSTLPPNSTLSSLLASAKGNDQLDMHQQELRRQTSLNHLDKVTQSKCKANMLSRGEAKLGSFQQRLKAMLSPPKDSTKVTCKVNGKIHKTTTSTYRAGDEINLEEDQVNSASVKVNSVTVKGHVDTHNTLPSSRPLSTLNKYTVSASSTSLSPATQTVNSFALDSYDEEESYHLRNVCNKLFSQKQYSCLQSSPSTQHLSDNVMSSMQKSSLSLFCDQNSFQPKNRNITPEMSVDKIGTKDSIYSSYHRRTPVTVPSMAACSQPDIINSGMLLENSTETEEFLEPYSTVNVNHSQSDHDHVVVVSDLQSKNTSSNNGLTVRSQIPSERVHSPKIIETNQGSSLSLNVAEVSESVASQEHNYKSSSESGRGTMNSHLEERSPHHLNSPADLTSLDSDQSNQEANWKETNGTCVRRSDTTAINMNGYSKIQRYLDDQRSSASKEADLTLCKEFKSKLSLHEESDSWTSMSDEPSSKKLSSKSKSKQIIGKNRHQVEPKLKTNFSKPENCLSPNTKQTSLSVKPLSPGLKQKMTLNGPKVAEGSEPVNSPMLYDKCIYSVPNKGKYRNMAPYSNVACNNKDCDNGSMSSDPESNFPDDGCSEFTDYFNHDQQNPLRKQLRGIEDMYSELLNMLNSKSDNRPRRKLYRRNSGRSSVASRNTRDYINRRYRNDHRRNKPDDLQMSRRYKKLESQVLTLAKSVSQLSADIQYNYMLNEEMESLRHEIEMVKSQMSNLKQNMSTWCKSQQHQQQHQQQAPAAQQASVTLNRPKESKKVDKLKRLFVDEPQPMKQFLKKLGYEKYSKHFEAEKIGLAELMHLNEDRLLKLGIPMGPRIRIIQEAKNLSSVINAKTQASKQQHNTLPESFNIYAVV